VLTSIVIEVETDDRAVRDIPGYLVHGWFLGAVRRVDAGLAALLHSNTGHKPFTLSPLVFAAHDPAGVSVGSIRITGLSPEVSAFLMGLDERRLGPLRLGGLPLWPRGVCTSGEDHPFAASTTFEAVTNGASGPDVSSSIRLAFRSPTAFASSVRNLHALFPDPGRVVNSLAENWNAHAPRELQIPTDLLATAIATLQTDAYDLRTVPVPLEHQQTKGFVGVCDYRVLRESPPEARRVLHRLAAFAAFAGVGNRTPQGMGQTFAIPIERESGPTRRRSVAGRKARRT
jgi:CRISPR-associated endoribonuclease Cas6